MKSVTKLIIQLSGGFHKVRLCFGDVGEVVGF